MDYPLLLGGDERGILKLERQGLYTLIEAAALGAEGLVRLWVQGGGEETYLGVMEPRSGGLYLRRKLSRLEMSGFPEKIERASDSRLEEVYIIKEQATEKDGGEPCRGKNSDWEYKKRPRQGGERSRRKRTERRRDFTGGERKRPRTGGKRSSRGRTEQASRRRTGCGKRRSCP